MNSIHQEMSSNEIEWHWEENETFHKQNEAPFDLSPEIQTFMRFLPIN